MDLPSSRELELETLLRHSNTKIAELTDEVTRLRQYLSIQPAVSTTDSVTLPPPYVSLLLPHIHAGSSADQGSSGSSTITAALTQRVQLLQQENDELYDILKRGETGKLKEEARGLRRVVAKLEGALQESHQVISSLSTELDKSYDEFMTQMRQTNNVKSASRSPRNSYHPGNHNTSSSGSKLPPTGPRAYKKPRVSDSPASSPSQRPHASLPQSYKSHNHSSRYHDQDQSPKQSADSRAPRSNNSNHRMVVDDEDSRTRPRSPSERDMKERHYRGNAREADRRDRDGGRRNGNFSGRQTRKFDRGNGGGNSYQSGDRTLAERMGL